MIDTRPRLTDKAQRENDAEVDNWQEAFELLGLIDAEFRSDPQSVQCFDSRIVERVRECVARYKELKRGKPYL